MSGWRDPRSFAAFAHIRSAAPAKPEPQKKEAPAVQPEKTPEPVEEAGFPAEEDGKVFSAAKERAARGEEDWRVLAMARTIKGMLKKD